ncbi:MAG: HemK family protein methyltransferase [Oscillospiraceae bacterium]|nr:HemK family protein methyltransferase [Oscillospiraceae bacterium]
MVRREIEEILLKAGVENASQEANWLVKHGKGDVRDMVNRRINGEPLQYIIGEWEFYGYVFKVGEGAFIPRPETELLVDAAKEHAPELVLDLCAGTGCVGIALAKETGCKVAAVEKSAKAFGYLKRNITLNNAESRVKAIKGDVLNLRRDFQGFDCVLINAPYLSAREMAALQKEVTYEPYEALYGGGDGLEFYRGFFGVWGRFLKGAKLFACEVGDGQAGRICRLMRDIGLSPKIKKDFNKINRVVYSTQT